MILHFTRQNLKTATSTRTGVLLFRYFDDLLTPKKEGQSEKLTPDQQQQRWT